jgi:hypothetical protein|tara:strand:+ start:4680 stop:4826 length:147 start_codon:yes stop_codon:yes gene_type:complete
MPKLDALKIVTDLFGEVVKFFDNAYNEGYLLYLIIGLILFAVIMIAFN